MFVTAIADADILIALSDQFDDLHTPAKKISQALVEQKIDTFFPVTAICEALKTLQSKPAKRGKKWVVRPDEAERLIRSIHEGVYPVLPIDEDIYAAALKMFEEENFAFSRGNTLFDAIIATVAKRLNAAVFSFDGLYKRMRLPLAKDLMYRIHKNTCIPMLQIGKITEDSTKSHLNITFLSFGKRFFEEELITSFTHLSSSKRLDPPLSTPRIHAPSVPD